MKLLQNSTPCFLIHSAYISFCYITYMEKNLNTHKNNSCCCCTQCNVTQHVANLFLHAKRQINAAMTAMIHVVATPIANPIATTENNKQRHFYFAFMIREKPAHNAYRNTESTISYGSTCRDTAAIWLQGVASQAYIKIR